MDRRALLAATGALAAASIAGCIGQLDGNDPADDTGDGDSDAGGNGNNDGDGDGDGPDTPGTEDLGGTPGEHPDIPEEALRALARDNAAFGLHLYRALSTEDDENLFLSPYSISVALAMTYAGARGRTRDQMAAVLGFDDDEEVHPEFAALQHELAEREETEDGGFGDEEPESVDAFKLRVANALWGREGVDFADEFGQLTEDYYGAGIAEADFVGDPNGERERINEWVADRTEDRIDELLPPNAISAQTILVLVNAIYFLASWESEFDPDDTDEDTFISLDGDESTAPFMVQHLRTDYADVDGARAVELRYVGGEVSMVLILPDEGTFTEFEADLGADRLFDIFDQLSDHTGDLALPQFEIESGFELGELLEELGMPDAFGGGADFSGMFENGGGAYIDEIYHDAFVTIDEEGTEAAASTAVVMDESAPPNWGELRFDRPFVFCIRDRPTDSVLFLGRVTDLAEN